MAPFLISGAVFGQISGVLSFLSFVIYGISTLVGRTKPNRMTWWALACVNTALAFSYFFAGARDTVWIAVSYAAGSLIIAILSIWHGEGGWEKLERLCIVAVLVNLFIWWISHSAVIALVCNIAVDFFSLLPTIKKAHLNPRSESKSSWILEAGSSLINLFAVERYSFAIIIYPMYLFLANTFIAALLFSKSSKKI